MLDWLRRDPRQEPVVEVAGRMIPVQIRRNDRARRLTMRLAPDGGAVLVTIPPWTPTREALAFAKARTDWIEKQVARVPAPVAIGNGSTFPLRGVMRTVHHDPGARRRVRLEGEELLLGGAGESLAPRLVRWLRAEALEAIAADLSHYCDLVAKPAPDLSLSSAQRRWGSCSARGVVRINWRLIMAPDAVRRSVVAHEVAHLVHFDHSPSFRALLADLFEGDLSAADCWLKREGRGLYAWFG